MNFKKKASKSIALALALVVVNITSSFSNAAVLETESKDSIYSVKSEEKNINDLIEMQEKIGIKFDINNDLTKEEIVNRFDEINDKYEIGEAFSNEDAEFVLLYSNQGGIKAEEYTEIPQLRNGDYGVPQRFSKKVTKYGLETELSGSVNFDIVGSIKNQYRYSGDYYTKCTNSHLAKMTSKITCVAYGVVGEGGIGKVYDGSKAGATRTTPGTVYTDTHQDISVFGHTISYLNVKATFTTKNGSILTVSAF